MLLQFAIRRIGRHWQMLLIPLLGVCLAAGLFALAPLYSRAVTELGLRYALETEPVNRIGIRVVRDSLLDETTFSRSKNILGDLFTEKIDVASSDAVPNILMSGERQLNGWFLYSYSDFEEHVVLINGRWSRPQLPYMVPSVGGLREDAGLDPSGRLVVRRAAADFEAVVSETVMRESGKQPGSRIRLGPDEWDPIVRIVGVFQPIDPDEAYWMAFSQPLVGTRIIVMDSPEYFGSLIVSRAVMERLVAGIENEPTIKDDTKTQAGEAQANTDFRSWIARLSGSGERDALLESTYDGILAEAQRLGFASGPPLSDVQCGWNLILDPDVISASTMREHAQNVLKMGETVASDMDDAQVITGLVAIIRVFLETIREVQAPVTFLTAGVLVLVLYYVLTTTSLMLEQQAAEWATISSRGGSTAQLLGIHAVTVLAQSLIAFVLSLPVAQGLLFLLRRVGPLAKLAVGPMLHIETPPETWNYAAIASLVAALAGLIPAIPAARRTIIALQRSVARPPSRPSWARFFLDFLLLALGVGLLLRAGQLGNLRTETFAGQSTVDALTIVAPLLLLTGGALLWLRIYPLLMAFLAALVSRIRGLGVPLAFWGISRNPGHYGQLVLLLLAAFGLGAMASGLDATRDSAAWRQARVDVGSAVRVELEEKADISAVAWDELPGVAATSAVFRGATSSQNTPGTLQIIGVEPQTIDQVTPVDSDLIQRLVSSEVFEPGGIALPDGVTVLSFWASHAAKHQDTQLSLYTIVSDRWGHPVPLEMEGDPSIKNEFIQWVATIPDNGGRPPWRFLGVALLSERGEAGILEGQLTIDDIEALQPDGSSVTIESFDAGAFTWSGPRDQDPLEPTQVWLNEEIVRSGRGAVTLGYRSIETSRYGTQPYGAWADAHDLRYVPVLVEEQWASQQGLKVGDPFRFDVTLHPNIRGQRVYCEIAGIIETFPTLGELPRPMVIGPLQPILHAINEGATVWPLEPNEIWLATDEDALPKPLLDALEEPQTGVAAIHTAFETREALRREPLANAFAGVLFGGFWVALVLSLVGFGYYLLLTARRRIVSFSVLRAVGWSPTDLWRMLVVEQVVLALPATIVGIALGVQLAGLIRSFIPLTANAPLIVPFDQLGLMVLGLGIGLTMLLIGVGVWLRNRQLARTLRLGGE